ncbi:TlpA family protein disulfide reductase [Cohnella hongkongensis]|uniref:TlpA family protein disulfide reductase n=1 Tax=Cohnella hongkongensis TaxID=178337 RepID=A0ABV9FBR8_9BACL
MNKGRNWAIAIAAAALLGGFLLMRQPLLPRGEAPERSANAALPEKPEIGYAAPAFSLSGLDGRTYSLEESRGKPVVLNFWASWCGPCREEAPLLVKLHRLYGESVHIVAVNLTAADRTESAEEFARSFGFAFPVPLDTRGTIAAKYRIRPIPTTIFIDSQGVIRGGVLGALNWELLQRRVLSLLEDQASGEGV